MTRMRVGGPVWSNSTVPEGTLLGRAFGGSVGPLTAGQAAEMVGVNAATPIRTMAAPVILDGVYNYNNTPFQQDSVIIRNGYIYTTLIGRGRNVMIARKPVDGGTWQTFNLSTMASSPFGLNTADGHNVVTFGFDSLGYIHVSGNMHGYALRYAVSTNPYDISAFTPGTMVGTNETDLTYPQFVNAANGDLLFFYRDGVGEGTILNRLPAGSSTWQRVAKVFTGGYPPYIDRISVGPDGAIHIFGCWRTDSTADSNADVFHVKSTDHGATWNTMAGAALTTPIARAAAPVLVDTADTGSGLINQTGTTVDTLGNPHKVYWLYDGSGFTQFHHLWHDGSAWHTEQISNFTSTVNLSVSTIAATLSRGGVFSSPDGRVWLLYRQNSDGLRGAIRVRDITPTAYGLSNLGDFPILSIDTWYSDPSAVVSGGKLLLLVATTGPDTVGHEDQPSTDLWAYQLGLITIVDVASIGHLAGAPRTARIDTVAATALTAAEAVTSYTSVALTSIPPVSVPPRHGDRLLMARVRGSVTSTTADSGHIELVSRPYSGAGTVLAATTVTPGAGGTRGFFTPWAPLDLYFGQWHDGGSVAVRARTDGGTMTVNDAVVELGIGVDSDGSSMLGPVGEVPVGAAIPTGALLADWDAANITGVSDGGNVTTLPDASGFGLDLAPTLGTPTLAASGIGGQPAVTFSGGQCLHSANVFIGHAYTVFVVAQSSSASTQTLVSQDTGTGDQRGFQAQITGASQVTAVAFSTSAAVLDTASGSTSSPFIMEMVRTQTGASTYTIEAFINGTGDGGQSVGANARTMVTYVDLGARSDGGSKQYLTGKIAKVLIYKGALTSGERTAIRAALAARFGITVA